MQRPAATSTCKRCICSSVAPNGVFCQDCLDSLAQEAENLAKHPPVFPRTEGEGEGKDDRETGPVNSADMIGAAATGDDSPAWPDDIFDPHYDSYWWWWNDDGEKKQIERGF